MQPLNSRLATATGSSKQRAVSQPAWDGPSNTSIFLRCLRLLDLDLRDDWPGLTAEHFTAKQQNLQQRVKGVEWALYRLFEMWDRQETGNKLRPFFPPLTSLQSINLRAALFRCLTELKKNGILGKETILRKTMLDDCKGEKFDDIIAKFAMSVLRKVVQSNSLAVEMPIPVHEQGQMLPVVLAYRHSLQAKLKERMRKEHDYQKIERALKRTAEEVRAGPQMRLRDSVSNDQTQESAQKLRKTLQRSWVGDENWIEYLINGKVDNDAKVLLGGSFDGILGRKSTESVLKREDAPADLLTDLNNRIAMHQRRIHKWIDFKTKLERDSTHREDLFVKKASKTAHPTFTAHKMIQLDQKSALRGAESNGALLSHPCHDLIARMHEELAAVGRDEPTPQIDKVSSFKEQPRLLSEQKVRQPTSDKQPLSQRTSTSILTSHAHGSPEFKGDRSRPRSPEKLAFAFETNPASPKLKKQPVARPQNQHVDYQADIQIAPIVEKELSTSDILHDQNYFPAPRTLSPLAESRTSSDNIEKPAPDRPRPPRQSSIPIETLMERTRQSMSLLPNQPHTANEKRKRISTAPKQIRHSQLFPVNQFETPPRLGPNDSPHSQESTPRETLFSEDADYSSVFKSRPRIATSPSPSPERSILGLDSMLEDFDEELAVDMGEVTLDSSPLRSRNAVG